MAVLGHVHIEQLLWLLLWAAASMGSVLSNRVLLHYHHFAVPWFLALMGAAAVAVFARILVFLTAQSSSHKSCREWLHVSAVGVLMWSAVALHAAALQQLPVTAAILVQAAGPAVSYWVAVALMQEDPDVASCLKALLSFGAVLAAILQHGHLSTAGLAMQAAAVFLDALWQRLQYSTQLKGCHEPCSSRTSISYDGTDGFNTPSSDAGRSSHSSGVTEPPSSGLVLLADSAPAAVLVLLAVMLKLDLPRWYEEQYRLKPAMPEAIKACVLICAVACLRAQPRVLQGLSHAPTGPLAHAVRDSVLVHLAVQFLNEAPLKPLQWVAYACAQAAAAALWAGNGCDSDSNGTKGYKKAHPLLG